MTEKKISDTEGIEEGGATRIEDKPDMELKWEGEYPFQQPVKFEGQIVKKVDYNLLTLKAKDLRRAKRLADKMEPKRGSPSLFDDDLVHAIIFCKSAGQPVEFAEELSAQDYGSISALVAAFFGSGLASCVR